MADLNDQQSSLTTKLTGANSAGLETNFVNANNKGQLQTEINLPKNDYLRGSFGGLRVVTTQNAFESLFSFDKQPLIWDETLTSGGTSTHNTNTNAIDMTLPTTSGAEVVRQTFRRIRYNPSRTVQILSAGVLGSPKANVRKRIGQFDPSDGVFFEIDGLTPYCVRRSSTSGSVVNTRYAQTDWNIDKFDGTGSSGLTIDFSKHNLYFIQYAFQGFGDIVWGFYLDGKILFCHRESPGNILTSPFMKTAHLPMRVEITNTGTAASTTTMSYNSCTVKNEGEDAEQEGQVLSYSNPTLKTVGTTPLPIISVRLGSTFQKAIADLIATTIHCQTADEVIWYIYLNPTLTASTFAITASYTQIDIAATTLTGGTELLSGIIAQNQGSLALSEQLLKYVNSLIGTSLAGTSTIITLAARSRTGSADILSTLTWREYP